MERPVSAVRDAFFSDLIRGYILDGEDSFLYRYFWADGVTGLLEEHFPQLYIKMKRAPRREDGPKVGKRLAGAMAANPDGARGKLLKRTPGRSRRDFWEELWLNDAGYRSKLITDTEYYLWLVDYLAAHDIYYKDTSLWDQRDCLDTLLKRGLAWEEGALEPGWRERRCDGPAGGKQKGELIFSTAQLKRDLAELAKRLRKEREAGGMEIAGRLHGLTCRDGGRPVDYLLWLTGRLARMALHIRIKTWLQDSGYPLIKQEDPGENWEEAEEGAKWEPFKRGARRKRDFTMGLFEAYCGSPEGYYFDKKDPAGVPPPEGWGLKGNGFCVLDPERLDALQDALKRGGNPRCYIPLAVDLYSGCVFFLAGKELYAQAYRREAQRLEEARGRAEKERDRAKEALEAYEGGAWKDPARVKELKKALAAAESTRKAAEEACAQAAEDRRAYKAAKARVCFDYLRLDGERKEKSSGKAFQLRPVFHKNAGQAYENILYQFKWYCVDGDGSFPGEGSPREAVRAVNQARPDGLPEGLLGWAFSGP